MNLKKKNYKSHLTPLLGLLISCIFLYFFLKKLDFKQIAICIINVNIIILSFCLISKFIGFLFLSVRSYLLFYHLNRYSFRTLLRSIFIAFVGNNILPMRIGEFARMHYLAREGNLSFSSCLATVGLERLMDSLCLLIIFFLTIPVTFNKLLNYNLIYIVGSLLVLLFVCLILISKYPDQTIHVINSLIKPFGYKITNFVIPKITSFIAGIKSLSSSKVIALVFFSTIAYWMSMIFSFQILIWAFGFNLPWYAPLVICTFVAVGTMIPSSPGFLGTYDYFLTMALTYFMVDPNQAASFAIVGHAMAVIPFTLIGIPFVLPYFLSNNIDRDKIKLKNTMIENKID